MEDWPKSDASLIDEDIEHSMSLVSGIVDLVAAERAKMGSKLRWPLLQVFVRGNDADVNKAVKRFDSVLCDQANVKKVVYLGKDEIPASEMEPVAFDEGTIFIDFSVTPEIEAEGYARELIRRIQQMRKDMRLNVEQFIVCQVSAEERLVGLHRQRGQGEGADLHVLARGRPGEDLGRHRQGDRHRHLPCGVNRTVT